MNKINYWHMQMHPDDKIYGEEHVYAILEHKKIVGLGHWENGEKVRNKFSNEMNVNDIIAIKNGEKLIALVQVIGGSYRVEDDITDIGWIQHRRPIRVLDWALDGQLLPHPQGTLNKCKSDDVRTTQIIKKWHEEVMKSFTKRKLDIYV